MARGGRDCTTLSNIFIVKLAVKVVPSPRSALQGHQETAQRAAGPLLSTQISLAEPVRCWSVIGRRQVRISSGTPNEVFRGFP